ncbi:MAG TPA: anthrone oxygenase family protein [Thermodesulfobacteriota bacterium]|nr:anthrone oxygenase family protein [Thermodesulfobacteriota bacterium]
MSDNILFFLTLYSAIGCGLMAGLFFIFSNTVMSALGSIKPAQGIAAMQSINRVILNPIFFIVFMGTAITCLIIAVSLIWKSDQPANFYLLSGNLFYLLGSMLVTIVKNVPMNNALDKVDPESDEGANLWTDYLTNWTRWNHVRTVACLLACLLLIIALTKM